VFNSCCQRDTLLLDHVDPVKEKEKVSEVYSYLPHYLTLGCIVAQDISALALVVVKQGTLHLQYYVLIIH